MGKFLQLRRLPGSVASSNVSSLALQGVHFSPYLSGLLPLIFKLSGQWIWEFFFLCLPAFFFKISPRLPHRPVTTGFVVNNRGNDLLMLDFGQRLAGF